MSKAPTVGGSVTKQNPQHLFFNSLTRKFYKANMTPNGQDFELTSEVVEDPQIVLVLVKAWKQE